MVNSGVFRNLLEKMRADKEMSQFEEENGKWLVKFKIRGKTMEWLVNFTI